MKRFLCITLCLTIVFGATLYAQRYQVFAIEGNAYVKTQGGLCKLSLGDYLGNESKIILTPKSAILLLDSKKKKKLPKIKGPQDQTLKKILNDNILVEYINCLREVFYYICGKTSNDFVTKSKDGNCVVNANSNRSLSNEKDSTLNELDKCVLQIMEQFYNGIEE